MPKRLLLPALIVHALLLSSCGPNDHLRDTYMGKPQNSDYQPIERDQNGNPILPQRH